MVKAQKASPDISVLNGLEFSPADDAAKIADAKKYISSLNVSGKAEMFTNLMTLASGGDTSRLAMLASQSEQALAAMQKRAESEINKIMK